MVCISSIICLYASKIGIYSAKVVPLVNIETFQFNALAFSKIFVTLFHTSMLSSKGSPPKRNISACFEFLSVIDDIASNAFSTRFDVRICGNDLIDDDS